MRVVEKFYSPGEIGFLVTLTAETIVKKLKAGEFGREQIVNLGSAERPDYRIAASVVNAWLASRNVFTEPGVAARSTGELRRKVNALTAVDAVSA